MLDVENKWPYLPITPTYDQYVQRWVVMPDREGFHLKTRAMETLRKTQNPVTGPVPVDLMTTNETTPDRGSWGGSHK